MKPTLKRVAYKRGKGLEQLICYGASARGSRFVIGSKAYKTGGLSKAELSSAREAAIKEILSEATAT